MLSMQPLSASAGNDYEDEEQRKSATQFFAIPGAARSSAPPAAEPSGGGRSMPQAPSQSIAPISGPVASSGGYAPPPPGGGPGASIPPPPPGYGGMGGGIQGPVASGPSAASPFSVAEDVGPPPGNTENRARSWRIYAILLALIGLVFTVAAIGILVVVFGLLAPDTPTPAPTPGPSVAEPSPRPRPTRDTATPSPVPQPVSSPRPRPRPGPTGPPMPSAPRPAPQPVVSTGAVTVTLEGASCLSAEITCPSGERKRGPLRGSTITIQDVPGSQSCTLFFKAPCTGQFSPVSGGRSYTCSFPEPGVASCR